MKNASECQEIYDCPDETIAEFGNHVPEARIGDFSGPPAPAAQRPQRRLSRFSASFVFAAKRGGAGSKNVQRAEEA
jgi:hypothetical protein